MSWGVYRRRSFVYHHPYLHRSVPQVLSKSFGRAVETWTARTLSFTSTKAIGRATETLAAQPIGFYKTVTPGIATETWTAQTLTFGTGPGGTLTPQLIVEIAFNIGADVSPYGVVDDTSRGLVNTALVASADVGAIGGVWTDVTDYVKSGSTRRGTTRVDSPVPVYETGTCTVVLDNSDRRFDPTNLDGPYVSAEVTQITPMRAIRVRATWDDVTYDLFRGYIDLWDITWDGPNFSEATVTASDAFKVLAGISRTAVAAVGAGETTGARIGRVLTSGNWATADRDIDTGNVTVSSTTLADEVLAELQLTAKTEIGDLYVSGSGKVVFRSRSSITSSGRSSISQFTFGDSGDAAAELPYQTLSISNDDATFYNKVRVTRVGGTEQTSSDTSSIAMYLERTYEASDVIMDSDAQALTWAQYIVTRSATPELRFDEMGVDPRYLPSALYPAIFYLEMSDRITVVRRPPGGGNPILRDVFVRGIEHTFSPEVWNTKFVFAQAIAGPTTPPGVGGLSKRILAPVRMYRAEDHRRYGRQTTIPHRIASRR